MAEYDVIVVGGGPAGSTAGYLLSNFGFRVLIIDKNNFPRQKLCGGLVTYKTVKLLERLFDETVEELKKKNMLNFESNNYEVFYKNKKPLSKYSFDIPFYFVDRYNYDNFLLRKAQKTGVEVIGGEKVISINPLRSEIRTLRGMELKARFIIGADGVNSIIRQSFPEKLFNKQRWQHDLATALEIFVDRSEIRKEINHPIIFFDFINWGYSWIFPHRDRLALGLCGLNRANKNSFLGSFYNFLSAVGLEGVKEARINGHSLPYGNFLLRPVYRNIILVGDAAGLVDPLLGEGIFYAQESAEFASWAIYRSVHEGEGLEKVYLQLLRKYLYPDIIYAQKIRHFIFTYFNKFQYYPLKILLKIFGKRPVESVQGIRSYKWLRRRKRCDLGKIS